MNCFSFKKYFSAFLLLTLAFPSGRISAQGTDFNYYTSLESVDPLPDFLHVSSTARAKAEMSPITGSKRKQRVALAEQEFLRHSTHEIDRLMASGRIVYNDPVGQYCNLVLRTVLAGETVPDHIKVYVLKSPVVNAFATRQGYIIVSLGLLARLKTEAELAFILCHEYIHVKHQHAIQSVRRNAEDEQARRRVPKDQAADLLRLESSKFSRALETEADLAGFNIFRKSPYALSAVHEVFYMLKQAEKPVDSLEVKPEWLSLGQLQIPEKIWALPQIKDRQTKKSNSDTPDSTKLADADERSYASHPDVGLRLAAIRKMTDSTQTFGTSLFVADETEFFHARKIAQYELGMLYLEDHRPELAFYHAKSLETRYEKGYFLTLTQVRALYLLASAHAQRRFGKVHWAPERAEGKEQKLMAAFHNLQREELLLLALKHAWTAKKDFPESAELKRIAEDLAFQLMRHTKFTFERFKTGNLPLSRDHGTDTLSSGKAHVRKGSSSGEPLYLYYGFQEEMRDNEFLSLFFMADLKASLAAAEENKKPRSSMFKRPPTILPEHLLVVRPQSTQLELRRKQDEPLELYDLSENNTHWMHEYLSELSSPKFPATVSVLSNTLSPEFNATNLNRTFYAQQYFRQIRFNETNKIQMWPLFQEESLRIFGNMGVSHLAEMKLLRMRYPAKGAIGRAVLLSVFLPYLTPVFIINALKRPTYNIWMYQVYDLEKGRKVHTYMDEIGGQMGKPAVKRMTRRSLKQRIPQGTPATAR